MEKGDIGIPLIETGDYCGVKIPVRNVRSKFKLQNIMDNGFFSPLDGAGL